MSRLVKAIAPRPNEVNARPGSVGDEGYLLRVGKYIPAEIVALYLPLLSILNAVEPLESHTIMLAAYGGAFLLFLALTPMYFTRMARPGDAVRTHRMVSTIAFVIWAYSFGGIFKEIGVHKDWLGAAFLMCFSAISGAIIPRK